MYMSRTDIPGSANQHVKPMASDPQRDMPDRTFIARSLDDGREFATVFDRHSERIWRYLNRRAGQAVADDLAGETFVRAFAARAGYDLEQRDARPWLYGIATNLLRERSRSESRRLRAYARAAESGVGSDVAEEAQRRVDAAALAPAVAAALAELTPNDRDALLLLALSDLDYGGIAVATGAPVGTVRSRLHRARRHMRLGLEKTKFDLGDLTGERSRT
jgi:RNA polymerase sigma factor (sigma-70 family)